MKGAVNRWEAFTLAEMVEMWNGLEWAESEGSTRDPTVYWALSHDLEVEMNRRGFNPFTDHLANTSPTDTPESDT